SNLERSVLTLMTRIDPLGFGVKADRRTGEGWISTYCGIMRLRWSMLRYKLRTLLILLAVLPPVLAWPCWSYMQWRADQSRRKAYRELIEVLRKPRVLRPTFVDVDQNGNL